MITRQRQPLLQTPLGGRLFDSLAQAEPEAALNRLKKLFTDDNLGQFNTNYSQLAWTLKKIARHKHLFKDAARLLLLLALAEAEKNPSTNHVGQLFVDLFAISISPKLSPTEAAPQERFPIIQEAIESTSPFRRQLGLQACQKALILQNFGLIQTEEKFFAKPLILWSPKTYGDLFDAYYQILDYLLAKIDHLSEAEQDFTIDILLTTINLLNHWEQLQPKLIQIATQLGQKPYVNKNKIVQTINDLLHNKPNMADELKNQWLAVQRQLLGEGFQAALRLHVGLMSQDVYDNQGNNEFQRQLEALIQQVMASPDLLSPELAWLMSGEAIYAYQFGYFLGRGDSTFSFLPKIISNQQNNPSLAFFGGYLRALAEMDRTQWEFLLDQFAANPIAAQWVVELTWRSEFLTDQAVLRILGLLKAGKEKFEKLQTLTIYSRGLKELSEPLFQEWVDFLVGQSNILAIFIALNLFDLYYVNNPLHQMPKELTLRLLKAVQPTTKEETRYQQGRFFYQWEEIAIQYVGNYPENSLQLSEFLLAQLFEKENPFFYSSILRRSLFLKQIVPLYPELVWEQVVSLLDNPASGILVQVWLRGEKIGIEDDENGFLQYFPEEVIWKWVEGNLDERLPRMVRFVPPVLFRDINRVCWVRELLIRYGDRESVQHGLVANFFGMDGWYGKESVHLMNKKAQMLAFQEGETNRVVREWIDKIAIRLDERIATAKIEEERDEFWDD